MKQGIFNQAVVTIYWDKEPTVLKEEGIKSTISDEGLYGQGFVVLEEFEDLYFIRTRYNYEGYVKKDQVYLMDLSAVAASEYKLHWVIKPFADVMTIPQVSGHPLLSVTRGAILLVGDKEQNGYLPVRLYDGREGFIKASYVIPYVAPINGDAVEQSLQGLTPDLSVLGSVCEADFRRAVVETAKTYMGTQYRWGGKSTLGIDCSGLTSTSYMLNGVLTYRDAKLLPGYPVKEITLEQAKPGDLLYFPGHIAMYIGDGEYIHSTARAGSDGVVINSLREDASNYRKDLVEQLTMVGSIFA